MVSGHVESLFSAAYDGELSAGARASFDRHLAECSSCAAAFAQLTTAVDALRELGPARMPRPVHLPEGSPVAARHFAGLRDRLPRRQRLLAGLSAVGVLAAAGVAAVVVIGHLQPGPNFSAASSAAAPAGGVPGRAALGPVPSSSACAGGCFAAAPSTACLMEPLSTGAAEAVAAAQVPAGFGDIDTHDDGITNVVLATQASSFAPGATVYIYARLIDDASGAVSLPCTYLSGPAVPAPEANAGQEVSLPGATIPATPAARITVDGQPVLQAKVPASAVPGETFAVIVEVPAGSGEAQAHQVSLSIQVS